MTRPDHLPPNRSTVLVTLVALGTVVALLATGCYSSAGVSSYTPVFDPDPVDVTVIGRDCSFHLAGLAFRDLATRQAARHALDGARDSALVHVTSRLVYPAPFEVCIEVEGVAVARSRVDANVKP